MKHSFEIVKLRFKTPLHLSKGKAGSYEDSEELLHSDTLKSALFAAALQLYGDGLDKQGFFNGFRVSSAFPYFGQEHFFPKPLHHARLQFPDEKKLKKIEWLGTNLFERVLRNETVQLEQRHFVFDDFNTLMPGATIGEKAVSDNPSLLRKSLYVKEKTQRVNIPKLWEDDDAVSMPYYLDKLYFNTEGGLYFMVYGAGDETNRRHLEAALRLLGENGIGLQRSLGNGQFEHEWATLELDLPEQATAAVSLSLYCPTWEEWSPLHLEQSAYNFVKRGGWISAADPEYISLRKRSIHMLAEGSVMPFTHTGAILLKGNGMIDLTPQTIEPPLPEGMKVWRDGTGVFLPISNS